MNITTIFYSRDGALAYPVGRRQHEDAVIAEALAILGQSTSRANYERQQSGRSETYLMLWYAEAEREEFGML